MTAHSAVRLHYERWGAGSPIVLLHPIAMRLAFWGSVAERLAQDFDVVSLDLRGHGDNAPAAAAFSIADMAADVIALCEDMALPRACFVGCSMGGMVAQSVALEAPERVEGLVLADTNHMIGEAGAAVMEARAETAFTGLERSIDEDLRRWFSALFRARDPQTVAKVRGWVLANDPRTVGFGWQAIAALDFGDRLAGVSVPVLVTTGSLDPASPPEAARRTAAAFPNGRYEELSECGHFSPLERPELFAALVARFAHGLPGVQWAETPTTEIDHD